MKFKRHVRIYFDECDPAGVVYFAKALHLAHQCVEEFIEHVGIGWNTWFSDAHLAAPIRHAEANFTGPLVAGRNYEQELSVWKLTDSTVGFLVEFKHAANLLAEVKTVHTFISKKDNKKALIPSVMRAALERYL